MDSIGGCALSGWCGSQWLIQRLAYENEHPNFSLSFFDLHYTRFGTSGREGALDL